MNKKLLSLVLSGLIFFNNIYCLENIYADNNNNLKELIKNEDTKTKTVVYLEDGEGDLGQGDGSVDRPYQNIRTALEKINNGDILKIKGKVKYSKYKPDSNGGALPLSIDKAITIEGETGAGLSVRAPIELKANVTFKDLNLELIPEVSLGKGTSKSSERILGTAIERSTTIYVNGHELTLDNINTKVGTNLDQSKDRPYISGGSHKSSNAPTGKSVINIINSNEETKFSGIYAGDYNKDVKLDVDINIDGKAKVTDNKIYTGGYKNNLIGNVSISLGANFNNIYKFDKSNHTGNIDVKLDKDAYITNFDATNIDNLTLEENSRIILAQDATFNVNNVVLKNDATIDFRDMKDNNPLYVRGNFVGEKNVHTSRKGGTIFLSNDQTLEIQGELSGTTRLNNRGSEFVHNFVENHIYVKTANSNGFLTIEDSMFTNYELEPKTNGNFIEWTIKRKSTNEFGNFKWDSGDNQIINTYDEDKVGYVESLYNIKFINNKGQEYYPDYEEIFNDFEYTLTLPNNKVVGLDYQGDGVDFGLYVDIDKTEIGLGIYTKYLKEGKFTLKVTHKRTQKSISRDIYLVKKGKNLTGDVSIDGEAIEGKTISANISKLQNDIVDVKYRWYVKNADVKYNLIQEQTGKEFVLDSKYVGKTIKVEVEAMNYLGTVTSNEVTIASEQTPDNKPVDTVIPDNKSGNVEYRTHIEDYGWQNWMINGEMSGTSGEAKRLEGIEIKVNNLPQGANILYRTHVQDYGWQDWKSNGEMSGTSGEAKRLEGIEIKLENAPGYSVEYRVHVQDYGWQDWKSDGEMAGTSGAAKRLEAIEIRIVKDIIPDIQYRTHVQDYGWQEWKNNGEMSGTSGEAKRLEGIEIKLENAPIGTNIVYQTHVQDYGWQDWKSDGEMSGTSGESKRLEGIKIKLENAPGYKVEYRVHVQDYGWQDWKSDGEMAGTSGQAKRLEGIEVRVVKR